MSVASTRPDGPTCSASHAGTLTPPAPTSQQAHPAATPTPARCRNVTGSNNSAQRLESAPGLGCRLSSRYASTPRHPSIVPGNPSTSGDRNDRTRQRQEKVEHPGWREARPARLPSRRRRLDSAQADADPAGRPRLSGHGCGQPRRLAGRFGAAVPTSRSHLRPGRSPVLPRARGRRRPPSTKSRSTWIRPSSPTSPYGSAEVTHRPDPRCRSDPSRVALGRPLHGRHRRMDVASGRQPSGMRGDFDPERSKGCPELNLLRGGR